MKTQNVGPPMGLQSGCIAAAGNQPSHMDEFGFYVNVFNLLQFAGAVLARPAVGLYVSSCPSQKSVDELCGILNSWKNVLNNLEPEQKARFEIDRPGEFDSMLRSLSEYEDHLEDLNFDLRQNPWARYLPKTRLTRVFTEVSDRIRNLDREYNATTKRYRRKQSSQAGGRATGDTAPTPEETPATGTTGDVEMLPISANAAADVTEQRLIDQDTIDQTERYRTILRVYANYSMPPGMQSTYAAIQNFVTSLLSPPDNSITMMPV